MVYIYPITRHWRSVIKKERLALKTHYLKTYKMLKTNRLYDTTLISTTSK